MKRLVIIALACLFLNTEGICQGKHLNLDKANKALQGYDPVSYFKENKAIKGRKELSFKHDGAIYWFDSQRNLELFQQDPSRFSVGYGGWCAYAMGASGEKVKIDPETFKVMDGKLYLFYNFYFTNTLTKWNEDETSLKTKADKNWEDLNKP
ncbi:MAG: YHS domain-containing (seleno)protein [Cyclobacteriaceae bacterium]